MSKKYSVTEEKKKQFASAYLLDSIINSKVEIPIYLEGNDNDLEPVLEYMMMKEYLSVENKEKYVPTDRGKEVLHRFMKRYSEFLKIFDIYCAVDLEEGCFAFEKYFNFSSEEEWVKYLSEERWEDLRVTVAEYKGINPVEIVFMSFLKEGQFGDRGEGWQFDLLLGSIWDEIIEVCDTALTKEDLSYTDGDNNLIDGTAVLEDVIVQGAELNLELHEKEKELEVQNDEYENDDDNDDDNERIYGDEIDTRVYQSYCQPMYISPLWGLLIFI
jgi:hypothetical protein